MKGMQENFRKKVKAVIRPENEDFAEVNCLLLNSVRGPGGRREEDVVSAGDALLGTVGIFEGPLGARCLWVVLNNSTLQLYQPSRYGFEPEDLSSSLDDWRLCTKIDDYDFISRRTGVYLRCSIMKKDLQS